MSTGLHEATNMEVRTKTFMQNAYMDGVAELAKLISKHAYEHAKWNPDNFVYTHKTFTNRIIAEKVLGSLKNGFLDCSVTMDYIPEGNEEGLATYRIDWS